MTPISTPINKPQPTDSAYGIDVLKTFTEYSRATYLQTFGVDADTYDPSLPTKTWFDSSADPSQSYTYLTFIAQNGLAAPVKTMLTITGAQASKINLYGLHSYPAYAIAPTAAAVVDPTGITNSPVQAADLSTRDQAVALATALGLDPSTVTEITMAPLYKIAYPSTEPRRIYVVTFKGIALTVGRLIQEQNANGVGAPGGWNLDGPEPNWISAIPSTLPPANPVQPVPMRDLMPNEAFQVGLMGVEIIRTDSAVASVSGGYGVTPSGDSPLLVQVAKDTAAIRAVFKV